jgi:DNA-binding CsgD family transcriptional regulator
METSGMQQVLAVARSAMGAICVVGADHRIRYWNSDIARLVGMPEASAIGRSCDEVFGDGKGHCPCCAALVRALAGEAVEPFEIDLRGNHMIVAPLSIRSPGQDAVVLSLFPRRVNGTPQEIGDPPLTHRETEVLRRLIDGWDTDRIAVTMSITRTTVRNHVQRLLRKLGAHSKLEAVAIATRQGLRGTGEQ